jgi:hypothetical protein
MVEECFAIRQSRSSSISKRECSLHGSCIWCWCSKSKECFWTLTYCIMINVIIISFLNRSKFLSYTNTSVLKEQESSFAM